MSEMKRLSRRGMLKQIGVAASGLAFSRCASRQTVAPAKRPNILFLFTDDQRFNTVNALGNPHVITPAMDRLVRQGTTFTHTYIQGSTTGAVCICSRAMLLTGRSLFRSPYQPRRSDGLVLWPEAFRQAGYTTFGTGKWHNGKEAFARCFTNGGTIFFGGMSDHRQVPVYDFDPTGQYQKSAEWIGDAFSSELFSDTAIQFLRRYDEDDPFFLYVSYTAPHDPRMAPSEYADLYPSGRIPLPENFMPEHPFDNGEMNIRDEQLAPWPRTPETVKEHIAAYYAMITHLDAQMGRVLDALNQSGHLENTLIVFASDNGLAVGQHGLMGKQNMYEHSVRVPLVVRGPGIDKNKNIESLVYLHDLFPTTCEMMNVPVPETVESQSLLPLLRGATDRPYSTIFAAYRDVQRMARDDRYKLIVYPQSNHVQLFDLKQDPWETVDLAEDSRFAAVRDRLMAELKQWRQTAGDELLI